MSAFNGQIFESAGDHVTADRVASEKAGAVRLRPWSLVAVEYQRRHGQAMTRSKAESIGRKALAKLMARMRSREVSDG